MTRVFVVASVGVLLPLLAAAQEPAPAPAPAAPSSSTELAEPPAAARPTFVRPNVFSPLPERIGITSPWVSPPPAPLRGWQAGQGQQVGTNVVTAFTTPYFAGLTALQQRQYERAITQFDRVVEEDERADGALYWKAFAQHRLGRIDAAAATLTALRQNYAQSRYLPDAKVLEAEVRRTAGRPLPLQDLSATDDIKLLALNGLANTDPARAVPMIGEVLRGANSLDVKRRAIYLLALNNKDERARQTLFRYATGGGNPDLQRDAISYLAADGRTTIVELRRIYEATSDRGVRRAIITAYRRAGDADALVALARAETDLPLKTEIVRELSQMAPRSPAAADYLEELLNR